jgi:hypothetical protein
VNFTRNELGQVPITLTVSDDAGNMDTCDTTIEVVDNNTGDFECQNQVTATLDENGVAKLELQEPYTGDASGINLNASRLEFTCADLGIKTIQLAYTGEINGSCTIQVEVKDELPPVINTDLLELSLDSEGFAYLETGMLSGEDNCNGTLSYTRGKSVFTCEDLGQNAIDIEAEDTSGNSSTKVIQVVINGEACETIEEFKYITISPNPSAGVFRIATPAGMEIERIRVFDSRGRFILDKNYNITARFYRMSLEAIEESVYTLQIFTNEGVFVKRVIIKK